MIKITKPRRIPSQLKTKGKEETKKLKGLFDKNPDAYLDGTEKFEFKNSIYGHKKVKETLVKAQYDKCCFCEKIVEIGEGDVEHFRGKGGYKQKEGDKLGKPGYYWLAYTWDNLLFSCKTCNSSYKQSFFPLSNPTTRAKSHHDNLKIEEPLFIHPAKENPEKYIEFIGSSPRAINGNVKGQKTIDRIGLRRPWVDIKRKDHYKTYKEIYKLSQDKELSKVKRGKLFKIVKDASQNKAPYASMIRSAIKQNFRF